MSILQAAQWQMLLCRKRLMPCFQAWYVWRGRTSCKHYASPPGDTAVSRSGRYVCCLSWQSALSPPPATQTRQCTCMNAHSGVDHLHKSYLQLLISRQVPSKKKNAAPSFTVAATLFWSVYLTNDKRTAGMTTLQSCKILLPCSILPFNKIASTLL